MFFYALLCVGLDVIAIFVFGVYVTRQRPKPLCDHKTIKNIKIILAIRDLQKIISNTETQEVVKVLKDARNSLIKIYADNKEELQQILTAIEHMSNQ